MLVGGGWYGSVVVGSGCWGRARLVTRHVWPYSTPALTTLYLGNQNASKISYAGVWASTLDMLIPLTSYTVLQYILGEWMIVRIRIKNYRRSLDVLLVGMIVVNVQFRCV
jgi:hypothetical protein